MNDTNEWLAATGTPTLINGEHGHLSKEHFLYRIVDVDDSDCLQESPEVEYYDPRELMPRVWTSTRSMWTPTLSRY